MEFRHVNGEFSVIDKSPCPVRIATEIVLANLNQPITEVLVK